MLQARRETFVKSTIILGSPNIKVLAVMILALHVCTEKGHSSPRLNIYTGIASQRLSPPPPTSPIISSFSLFRSTTRQYCSAIHKDLTDICHQWPSSSHQLEENVDYSVSFKVSDTSRTKTSFGRVILVDGQDPHIDPDSITSCAKKISTQWKICRDIIAKYFTPADGFVVSPHIDAKIDNTVGYTREITLYPVTISNIRFPEFNDVTVILGSGPESNGEVPSNISQVCFNSAYGLHERLSKNIIIGIPNILDTLLDMSGVSDTQIQDSAQLSSSKSNLTFGLSVGYDKTFIKEGGRFGLYTGAEIFADINPSRGSVRSKSGETIVNSSCDLKTRSFGFTALVGLASKNNWTIYGLGGIRCSFKTLDTKFTPTVTDASSLITNPAQKISKDGIEFDVGAGSTYTLSKNWAIGVRYTHTLKSSIKFKSFDGSDAKLTTRSSRITASLTYMFD